MRLTTPALSCTIFLFFAVLQAFAAEPAEETAKLCPSAGGMQFVLIPEGKSMMGFSLDREPGERLIDEVSRPEDEKPRHRVTISSPFYAGKFEVTVGQVLAWLNAPNVKFNNEWVDLESTNCPIRRSGEGFVLNAESNFGQSIEQPMVEISWSGANAYCQWCSREDPMFTYRLPTEAEWEYMARAGSTTSFPFGVTCDSKLANIGPSAAPNLNRRNLTSRATVPIGSYKANDWGLHDTVGNTAEWCSDWYDAGYYLRSPENDPQGPLKGEHRCVRGGSWLLPDNFCTSSARLYRQLPSNTANDIGFRVIAERNRSNATN